MTDKTDIAEEKPFYKMEAKWPGKEAARRRPARPGSPRPDAVRVRRLPQLTAALVPGEPTAAKRNSPSPSRHSAWESEQRQAGRAGARGGAVAPRRCSGALRGAFPAT